jgi:hypothetical protein
MSIQKKSLISTLKTAKKANVASSHDGEAKGTKASSMRLLRATNQKALRQIGLRTMKATPKKFVG